MKGRAPLYESDSDKQRESRFIADIQSRFKCTLHKLSITWQVDCLVSRGGRGIGFAEIKCRTHRSDEYPTLIMSDHKIRYAFRLGRRFYVDGRSPAEGFPLLIFVRWKDRDGWARLSKAKTNLDELESRPLCAKNHADPRDTERVVYLPMSWFTFFSLALLSLRSWQFNL